MIRETPKAANTWLPYCLFTLIIPLSSHIYSSYTNVLYTCQSTTCHRLASVHHILSMYFLLTIQTQVAQTYFTIQFSHNSPCHSGQICE